MQTRDNRYGAIYSFNYDILRGTMLQQRISGFYNAQCCGIAFEYQRYNFAGVPSYWCPPTTASSSRSRSPGSVTSRRSAADERRAPLMA